MGSRGFPCVIGRMQGVPRAQRVCPLCQSGQLGDEQHPVFHCTGLQAVRYRHEDIFGEHATTMLEFIWQDDMRVVASFNKE